MLVYPMDRSVGFTDGCAYGLQQSAHEVFLEAEFHGGFRDDPVRLLAAKRLQRLAADLYREARGLLGYPREYIAKDLRERGLGS